MTMTKKDKKKLYAKDSSRLYDKWKNYKIMHYGFLMQVDKVAVFFVLLHFLSIRLALWEAAGEIPFMYGIPVVTVIALAFSQLMHHHANLNRNQVSQDEQMQRISRMQDKLNTRLLTVEKRVEIKQDRL